MKKIVYPILLLILTACKGNQQTTNNESAAIPVAETIADTIAQPEVDAITSATSKPNQVSFNGRIVLPPQRQATIALTMGGIVKKASLLPGQWVAANSVIATLENPEFITLQQTYLDSHAQTEYLLAEYERQKNLSADIPAKEEQLEKLKASAANVDAFIEKAKRYTTIDELTPELLRLFIQRIEVGERSQKYSRSAGQSVRIVYRDIGRVDSPMQEGEHIPYITKQITDIEEIKRLLA